MDDPDDPDYGFNVWYNGKIEYEGFDEDWGHVFGFTMYDEDGDEIRWSDIYKSLKTGPDTDALDYEWINIKDAGQLIKFVGGKRRAKTRKKRGGAFIVNNRVKLTHDVMHRGYLFKENMVGTIIEVNDEDNTYLVEFDEPRDWNRVLGRRYRILRLNDNDMELVPIPDNVSDSDEESDNDSDDEAPPRRHNIAAAAAGGKRKKKTHRKKGGSKTERRKKKT